MARSTANAQRAEATRRRIVAAAGPLFAEQGYLETTMAALARAAGVAVQTLYLSFGSKSAVLEAALAAVGEDQPSEWVQRLRAEPDGLAALRDHVTTTTVLLERRHPLLTVLRSAAADPEPAAVLERAGAAAFAFHAAAVDELAEKDGFTDRISLQRATEIVAATLSPDLYGHLVVHHGWPSGDWTGWTTRRLGADLFPNQTVDPVG
ncbi:TetR/AcrR family transcriptional regulator [Actinomycetes bacterium KLBMP 9759]